jgi:hypothetical protein
MFKNFLKIACLWIESETSFDKNFEHYDRIAQVMQTLKVNGEMVKSPQVPVPWTNPGPLDPKSEL